MFNVNSTSVDAWKALFAGIRERQVVYRDQNGEPRLVEVQSDLLKPISNVLSVRDDTFRIRAYGEVRDQDDNVSGSAWCEAIVQRIPEYIDPADDASETVREITTTGEFSDSGELSMANLRFGRQFKIVEFRWLSASEI